MRKIWFSSNTLFTSSFNCLRTLPHLKAWDATYRKRGLVILGVHTPEFAFEHVTSNVRAAVKRLGIRYPVVQDNRFKTWDNYANQYWPAEYLIDRSGRVRHTHFGEGEYPQTESLIRRLRSREENNFTDRMISIMRGAFGGHEVKKSTD